MLITILLSFIFGIIAGLLLTVGSLLYLVKAKCPQCKKLKPFREIAVIDPNIRAISGKQCRQCQKSKSQITL